MNLVLEGPRMTGKSTLFSTMNGNKFKDKSYHFNPYKHTPYLSELFYTGKDFAIMQFLCQDMNWLVDRFFITSLVYAEFCRREFFEDKWVHYRKMLEMCPEFLENTKFFVIIHTDESIKKALELAAAKKDREGKDDFTDDFNSIKTQNELYKKVCNRMREEFPVKMDFATPAFYNERTVYDVRNSDN